MARCEMKFEECRRCLNYRDPETCEDCDSGELFEEDDGLDFEGERQYDR